MSSSLAHDMLEAALRAQAEDYAATLRPGDIILESTDGPTIHAYRRLLPVALIRLGLGVELMPGGRAWVVRRLGPAVSPAPTRLQCRCGSPWFDCGCKGPAPVEIRW
jgi:hypothetical protein